MNKNEGARAIASPMAYLETDLGKLVDAISGTPTAARELEDHQLLALAAWTQDGNDDIKAECVRRAEQGRRFARYLGPDELVVTGTLHRLQDVGRPDQS
jgi:hypothetical protein